MRGNCLTSRHEENRLIPVASLGVVVYGSHGWMCVCMWLSNVLYCGLLLLLLFIFVFFVALYDLSSGLDELGRSRSFSVVMLVGRWPQSSVLFSGTIQEKPDLLHACVWQLLRSWVALQAPLLGFQREDVLTDIVLCCLLGPLYSQQSVLVVKNWTTLPDGETQPGHEITL